MMKAAYLLTAPLRIFRAFHITAPHPAVAPVLTLRNLRARGSDGNDSNPAATGSHSRLRLSLSSVLGAVAEMAARSPSRSRSIAEEMERGRTRDGRMSREHQIRDRQLTRASQVLVVMTTSGERTHHTHTFTRSIENTIFSVWVAFLDLSMITRRRRMVHIHQRTTKTVGWNSSQVSFFLKLAFAHLEANGILYHRYLQLPDLLLGSAQSSTNVFCPSRLDELFHERCRSQTWNVYL